LYDQAEVEFISMSKSLLLSLLLIIVLSACKQNASSQQLYPNQVGDIEFDEKIDDPQFKTCNKIVFQYYNFGKGLQYQGEKIKILEAFKEFNAIHSTDDSGYVTIRFIVNCEGKTGRFRIQEMNNNYEPKKFSDDVKTQLLKITQSLNGWIVSMDEGGSKLDYYQYLTFKLESGRIIEIMP